MSKTKRFSFLMLVLALLVNASGNAPGFKLVANNSVRVRSLSKKEASDLFMKRTTKWEGGAAVVAVDQTDHATVRDQFSRAIHGKSMAAVKSYWNQQIFSGREVPPVEKQNDAEVLAFVRSTAGAIGYVSETAPADGVRVIEVN